MVTHSVSRRAYLAAVGSAVSVGVTGCSGVTQQTFAATPVVLPGGDREELALGETVREGVTVTREGPTGNAEVEITSETSLYQRGAARGTPTVLEAFTGMVNGTPGSGSVINVLASDAGIDEASLSFLDGGPAVGGEGFSIVMPAGARGTGSVSVSDLAYLVPGASLSADTVTTATSGAFFPEETFFPDEIFFLARYSLP